MLAILLFAATDLSLADEPLVPKRHVRRAAFFGQPELRIGSLRHELQGFVGAKLGVLIHERWQLGFSGYGHYAPTDPLALAYGGVSLEYVAISFRWFRLTLGALLGGGAYYFNREIASFFAVEPVGGVEFRPARWLGLGVSGGYRFTATHPRASLQRRDLDGWFAGLHIRFGL